MPVVPEEDETRMEAEFDDFINWEQAEPESSLGNAASGMDFMSSTTGHNLSLGPDPMLHSFNGNYTDGDFLLDHLGLNSDLAQPAQHIPDLRDHLADPCLNCRANGYACKRIREGTHRDCCTGCVAFRVDCSLVSKEVQASFGSGPLHSQQSVNGPSALGGDSTLGGSDTVPVAIPMSRHVAAAKSSGPGSAKISARLSKESVKILKAWFAEHSKHPYPTEEEKENLQRLTQLTKVQITNYLANFRRRNKMARPRSTSPSVRNDIHNAIDIPRRRATPAPLDRRPRPSHYEEMDPLERWKNSPPEHEPASVTDIARAVCSASTTTSSGFETPRSVNFTDDSRSQGRGSSVSSLGTSRTSQSSANSFASAYSHGSRNSFGSFSSLDRGRRRRRRRALPKVSSQPTRTALTQPANTYQCTFCPQTFKAKYDWQRHEKSLHLSLESWVCAPKGAKAFNPETSQIECVFCSEPNPSQDHLETHNYSICQEKGISERTFYRKDHLRQHLRLVHNTKFVNWAMPAWEQKHDELESSCGFCGIRMTTWTARVEHLAGHFKAGSSMAEWKGDWGFSPSVVDKVQNAIPPYMVHEERNSPFPFVANNSMPETPVHAYELLKTELVYWAQNYREQFSRAANDEELVHEACRIIFGAEVLSQRGLASAPSWLRDLLMGDEVIAQQARLSPIRSGADSHISVLKVNGKDNIFDSCPLEQKLLKYVNSRTLLGLTATDEELQLECCKVLGHFEETSSNPSELVGNLLVRLVKGSKVWLADFRRRARLPRSEEMIDPDRRPTDGKSLDSSIHNFYRLERELAQHVRSQRALGIEPDGADLQRTARIIIYGNDDGWNQTAADSPEWLSAFRDRLREAGSREVLQLSDPLNHLFDPDAEIIALQNSLAANGSTSVSPAAAKSIDRSSSTLSPTCQSVRSVPFFIHDINCYKRLEKELGRWVVSVMSPHNPSRHVPTDAELQHQARWICFDDDDPWNVTAADNCEWLRRFKRDHGIISDDSGPGLPDVVGWSVHHGGTGFAPPYVYPTTAIEETGGGGGGTGTVQIPVRAGAKPFEADQRAVDSYLQGLKTRYPPPPTVFCSRELEAGLTEFVQSQQMATGGALPSDEMLRAKAKEILGTETTAAEDVVLLDKFKAIVQTNMTVTNAPGPEADLSLMSSMQMPLPDFGEVFGMQVAATNDDQFDAMMHDYGADSAMEFAGSPTMLLDMQFDELPM